MKGICQRTEHVAQVGTGLRGGDWMNKAKMTIIFPWMRQSPVFTSITISSVFLRALYSCPVCCKTALKVWTPHIIVRILSNLYQWLKIYLFHFKFNYCCWYFWIHTQPELRVLILDRCSEITLTSAPGWKSNPVNCCTISLWWPPKYCTLA